LRGSLGMQNPFIMLTVQFHVNVMSKLKIVSILRVSILGHIFICKILLMLFWKVGVQC